MIYDNILGAIGGTPVVRLSRLFGAGSNVWAKLERANPGGSIKDRIALAMIEEAERQGLLRPGSVVIEPTSGNTGIGLAMVCAVKGYSLILCMPESFSVERRRVMAAYGATLVLTPAADGMRGAIARANELHAELGSRSWVPMQFDNPANVEAHVRATAVEIANDFPDGLDMIVGGVGTGGHLSGCAQALKPGWPGLRIVGVEPDLSPVLSGGNPGPHRIQGIGAGFVPSILRRDLIDEVVTVSWEEAASWSRRCATEEGILVGISSGASLAATAKVLDEHGPTSRVLAFTYDSAERYMSVGGFMDAP